MVRSAVPLFLICAFFNGKQVLGNELLMYCQHSFQGNYSGGYVLLKYQKKMDNNDKAFIKGKNGWVELCTDVKTHGRVKIKDYIASCSIYLANWMDGKRKNYIWNFKEKQLSVQTLINVFNYETNLRDWQWRFFYKKEGSSESSYAKGWESQGIMYEKRKCISEGS